jgi:tripartite-type tricarboxylate transporter receptor subunit TctC
MQSRLIRFALAAMLSLLAAAAHAQYPSKPVKFLVPYPAGQATDVVARLLADGLSKMWGQQVIVENRGGGAAIPGLVAGRDAPADGYTITLGTSAAVVVNQAIFEKLPYDVMKDFVFVVNVFRNPLLIVTNAGTPYYTLKDVVDAAKKEPGKLNWGYPGMGTTQHLTGEMFKFRAGVDIQGVMYKGSAPAVTDLLGNQIPLSLDSVAGTFTQIKAGKLRAIAITTAKRIPQLPDVPTVAESGYPEFEGTGWGGLIAPKGTPPEIVEKIATDVLKLLADKEMQAKFVEKGLIIEPMASKEWTEYVKLETQKWHEVAKRANVKAE